uniref:Uncharacterized protein n=1 Tax=Caenorhabditis japonica TaxID=281687 RepID=A0A8R1HHI1_CAEJA
MKPPTARKTATKRPTTTISYPKRSASELEEIEEAPPDPRARNRSDEMSVHCLLREIDDKKLITLIGGHPSARSTALILQALRQVNQILFTVKIKLFQQMSVAALDEYSLFVRVLQADGVDSREQMARLVNAMASYTTGRSYFTGEG